MRYAALAAIALLTLAVPAPSVRIVPGDSASTQRAIDRCARAGLYRGLVLGAAATLAGCWMLA